MATLLPSAVSGKPATEPTQQDAMRRAYANALRCQGACNLSGVLYSFARDMAVICKETPRLGTDDKNHHPIVRMYLSKLVSLAGMIDGGDIGDADEQCCDGASITMDQYRRGDF